MTTRVRDELKQRAWKAIIAHAIFRMESALAVCLTILLAFFVPEPLPWWRWWYWAILGAVTEALIIYTSITDERTGRKVVAEMLREQYSPGTIKTRSHREKVEQALEYRERIESLIETSPAGILRDHLYESTVGIADWIKRIFAIAQRLDTYERDELLHRDMSALPASIRRLREELANEDEPSVVQQIEATLAAKGAQRDNLQALQNRMEQAQFRLEETLTALGTVYSQFQLIQARKLGGAGARRLSEDIREQVQGLQDLIDSMNELESQSRAGHSDV